MAAELREAAKRRQTRHLRALLTHALTFAGLTPLRAALVIEELFVDAQFVALNKAFHDEAFTVFLNSD